MTIVQMSLQATSHHISLSPSRHNIDDDFELTQIHVAHKIHQAHSRTSKQSTNSHPESSRQFSFAKCLRLTVSVLMCVSILHVVRLNSGKFTLCAARNEQRYTF